MKKLFFKELILLFLFLILTNSMSFSQTWNLPESKRNTRHTSDLKANIVRPALTIRGFDNGDLPTYHSDNAKIYGVKQILERA